MYLEYGIVLCIPSKKQNCNSTSQGFLERRYAGFPSLPDFA